MKFEAAINIMPLDEILDPQGKVVQRSLDNLDIKGATQVRVGKHITMMVEADDAARANTKVEEACKKLLANLIVERYEFTVKALETA